VWACHSASQGNNWPIYRPKSKNKRKKPEKPARLSKGDSKMQGNWGQLVLERVLKKSVLEKDRKYRKQSLPEKMAVVVLPELLIELRMAKR